MQRKNGRRKVCVSSLIDGLIKEPHRPTDKSVPHFLSSTFFIAGSRDCGRETSVVARREAGRQGGSEKEREGGMEGEGASKQAKKNE